MIKRAFTGPLPSPVVTTMPAGKDLDRCLRRIVLSTESVMTRHDSRRRSESGRPPFNSRRRSKLGARVRGIEGTTRAIQILDPREDLGDLWRHRAVAAVKIGDQFT